MTSSRRFRCEAKSVGAARHFVRDVLREQPRETVEAAELMTSELATNSVRHAHSDFELAIHCSRRDIRIEVSDNGQGQPTPRSPAPHERSGRGLRIVQELSDTWGTVSSRNGKMVWFTLPAQTFAEREPRSTADSERGIRPWRFRRRIARIGRSPRVQQPWAAVLHRRDSRQHCGLAHGSGSLRLAITSASKSVCGPRPEEADLLGAQHRTLTGERGEPIDGAVDVEHVRHPHPVQGAVDRAGGRVEISVPIDVDEAQPRAAVQYQPVAGTPRRSSSAPARGTGRGRPRRDRPPAGVVLAADR